MNGNPLVVIQARLASSRFHEKVLADLNGKPVLQHVIDRARQIKGVADVIVAVPNQPTMDRLIAAGITGAAIVPVSKVSENDVLGRFAWIASEFKSHDVFVRISGDSPLLDPRSAERVLQRFLEGELDYVSNMDDGGEADVEVFSRDALEMSDKEAATEHEREHVSVWMKQNLRTDVVPAPKGSKPAKKSIDVIEELEALRKATVVK